MSMRGIDISNWQAGIDLDAVDYEFVMMKAMQGKYGNRDVRKFVLGTRYEEVQELVNTMLDS